MPELEITVEKAEVVPFAASPMLGFRLRVQNAGANERIHTVVLRCQIQIEVSRRRYTALDQQHLKDLFGEPERWGQTLRNLHWTNATAIVPQFTGVTTVELQVPCTFDFSVATTKYFNGLSEGEIPICLMFSGTVFYADPEGALQVAPISWAKETKFRLPLQVWKDMMDAYYPNIAWLCLRRDVFEELQRFKIERGIPTLEQAMELLLFGIQSRSGADMNIGAVEKVADAVLYEGYILYPYRASAGKNQHRFNFGVLYPREYCELQLGAESWEMKTECLVIGSGSSTIEVKTRFLQLASRQEWQEGQEREISISARSLQAIAAQSHRRPFLFQGVEDAEGRKSEMLQGETEFGASRLDGDLFKVTLTVRNLAKLENANDQSRNSALLRSMVSVHSILQCAGGEFVSLLDPPEHLKPAAAGCQNAGAWPVLAGEEGQRDLVLAAPIILYDYPQIAPESPGDLCDGTEIDEILALRILTMTDAEKLEVRNGDDRARRILERTELLPPEHFQKLHGALRSLRSSLEEPQ